MVYLFVFLLIILITVYAIHPTNKTQIGLGAVFVPLGALLFYGLLYISSFEYSYSYATAEIGMCLLPTLISGLVIYFLLKKKFENENKVKFPTVLVVFMGIAVVVSIIDMYLKYNIQ